MMMRLEAPKPLRKALVAIVFSLAFIQNMRSEQFPGRAAGDALELGDELRRFRGSGSYLLNSGRLRRRDEEPNSRSGSEMIQK